MITSRSHRDSACAPPATGTAGSPRCSCASCAAGEEGKKGTFELGFASWSEFRDGSSDTLKDSSLTKLRNEGSLRMYGFCARSFSHALRADHH